MKENEGKVLVTDEQKEILRIVDQLQNEGQTEQAVRLLETIVSPETRIDYSNPLLFRPKETG